MKIKLSSAFVDDQDKALQFYTDLFVEDVQREYGRLTDRGVVFPTKPTKIEGPFSRHPFYDESVVPDKQKK